MHMTTHTSNTGPVPLAHLTPIFFAYPVGTLTYPEWCDILIAEYNAGLWYYDRIWVSSLSDLGGGWIAPKDKFIDVVKVASDFFNYSNRTPKAAQT